MDDYKRTLYMLAQARLKAEFEDGGDLSICATLAEILWEEGESPSPEQVQELFSEFHALYDGYTWTYFDGAFVKFPVVRGEYWWSQGHFKPRMRALDVLLRD